MNGCESEASHCKPCRFIFSVDKKPLRLLRVSVQQQYTVSKKETLEMAPDQKSKLISATVRIMGTPDINNLYFVAKDVCLLIHIRKGNVAKSISQFNDNEKARMPVLCERSNGVVSTHVLTVLTVPGVIRLLTTSQSKHAPAVLKWITGHIEVITGSKVSSLTVSSPRPLPSSSSSSSSSTSQFETESKSSQPSQKKAFHPLSPYQVPQVQSPMFSRPNTLSRAFPNNPLSNLIYAPSSLHPSQPFPPSYLPPVPQTLGNPMNSQFALAMANQTRLGGTPCGTALTMGMSPQLNNFSFYNNPVLSQISLNQHYEQ